MSAKALSVQKECFGESHPDYARAACGMGIALRQLNKHAEALALLGPALATLSANLGERDADMVALRKVMAKSHESLGQHAEALLLLAKNEPVYKK